MSNKKIEPCKWYYACPIKKYTEKGKLETYWIENYCLVIRVGPPDEPDEPYQGYRTNKRIILLTKMCSLGHR